MIAQVLLSLLLAFILVYAWIEYRRTPTIAVLSGTTAFLGLCFVWFPSISTNLADLVGIGRGVDLVLYFWACITLLVFVNLHLKLRTQLELITVLTRTLAIMSARPEWMGNERSKPEGAVEKTALAVIQHEVIPK